MKPCYIVISATGERVDLNPTTNPNEWTAGERAGMIYDPNDPDECVYFEVDDPNDPRVITEIPFSLYAADGTLLAKGYKSEVYWA